MIGGSSADIIVIVVPAVVGVVIIILVIVAIITVVTICLCRKKKSMFHPGYCDFIVIICKIFQQNQMIMKNTTI